MLRYNQLVSARDDRKREKSEDDGAHMFGIVTAEQKIGSTSEWSEIGRAVSEIKKSVSNPARHWYVEQTTGT